MLNSALQSRLSENPSGDTVYLQVGSQLYEVDSVTDPESGKTYFAIVAGSAVDPQG